MSYEKELAAAKKAASFAARLSQLRRSASSLFGGYIFFDIFQQKIWDHAAGCIVVTEAGGVVTDAAGNALDFSKGRYLDLYKGIIVTNQRLMPSLLKAVPEALQQTSSSTL
ncbi:3'(2'),5'-bisphosphate nucleotidase isoform X1 [Cucumis sativus]|uniref:3'(2'),5'-bisphosphate nucleotidase isoform X1 n=1 Tax=Cucumis sativus TaxID=3659 RepID=UPI0012F4AACB|nr:3'(2'),5'-bisphosphate nucleotidase isoform X1 [Cucumis sativus]